MRRCGALGERVALSVLGSGVFDRPRLTASRRFCLAFRGRCTTCALPFLESAMHTDAPEFQRLNHLRSTGRDLDAAACSSGGQRLRPLRLAQRRGVVRNRGRSPGVERRLSRGALGEQLRLRAPEPGAAGLTRRRGGRQMCSVPANGRRARRFCALPTTSAARQHRCMRFRRQSAAGSPRGKADLSHTLLPCGAVQITLSFCKTS